MYLNPTTSHFNHIQSCDHFTWANEISICRNFIINTLIFIKIDFFLTLDYLLSQRRSLSPFSSVRLPALGNVTSNFFSSSGVDWVETYQHSCTAMSMCFICDTKIIIGIQRCLNVSSDIWSDIIRNISSSWKPTQTNLNL